MGHAKNIVQQSSPVILGRLRNREFLLSHGLANEVPEGDLHMAADVSNSNHIQVRNQMSDAVINFFQSKGIEVHDRYLPVAIEFENHTLKLSVISEDGHLSSGDITDPATIEENYRKLLQHPDTTKEIDLYFTISDDAHPSKVEEAVKELVQTSRDLEAKQKQKS